MRAATIILVIYVEQERRWAARAAGVPASHDNFWLESGFADPPDSTPGLQSRYGHPFSRGPYLRVPAYGAPRSTSNPLLRGGGVLRGIKPGFGHYSTPKRCYSDAALLRGRSPPSIILLQ